MVLYKALCGTRTNSLNGLANTRELAGDLTAVPNLQKPVVSDLRRQDGQMVLSSKDLHICA
jgi:hypothetical protein